MPDENSSKNGWIVAAAIAGMLAAMLGPLMYNQAKLGDLREADRSRIESAFATLAGVQKDRDALQNQLNDQRREHDTLAAEVLRIEAEQRTRTSPVASVPMLDRKIDALTIRFNEAEKRGVSSPAEEMRAMNVRIEHLQDMILRVAPPQATEDRGRK